MHKRHLALILLLAACGSAPEQVATDLAQIDGHPITQTEFLAFEALIPEGMKTGETALEKATSVLNSLIDKQIMIHEAEAINLGEDADFRTKLKVFSRNRLVDLYTRREITQRIEITEAEIEEHFRATNRDRALRFSGIMLESQEQADAVYQQLVDGVDFHQLAQKHSLHRETGEQGGDSGGYKLRDQVLPNLAVPIFKLKVGEYTKPIPMAYLNKKRVVIFKILDETPAPLEAVENKVREEIFGRKRVERTLALMDSLNREYQPQINPETLQTLVEQSTQAAGGPLNLSTDIAQRPIISYRDGHINLDELWVTAQELRISSGELADTARVNQLLQEVFGPGKIVQLEARQAGLDRDPSLLATIEQKRLELLVEILRQRFVSKQVSSTEEEARAFYEANKEKFIPPETHIIVEIQVASDSLAQELKAQLDQGADPVQLAKDHTLRTGTLHHDGQIRLTKITQAYYPEMYAAVQNMEIGQSAGPLQVRDGYSVFKYIDHEQKEASYNKDARRRSHAYVKIDKSKRGYVNYVRQLREKYPLEIHLDRLALLVEERPTAP
ncbi:MAG: hypothetical protein GKR89_20015 [Candidatus Latescibacteria bacterium]|nr:hypothetical protein [Candidatus Latescibacterota bacterium]